MVAISPTTQHEAPPAGSPGLDGRQTAGGVSGSYTMEAYGPERPVGAKRYGVAPRPARTEAGETPAVTTLSESQVAAARPDDVRLPHANEMLETAIAGLSPATAKAIRNLAGAGPARDIPSADPCGRPAITKLRSTEPSREVHGSAYSNSHGRDAHASLPNGSRSGLAVLQPDSRGGE